MRSFSRRRIGKVLFLCHGQGMDWKKQNEKCTKKFIFFFFFETYVQKVLIIYKKSVNIGCIENLMRKRSKYVFDSV